MKKHFHRGLLVGLGLASLAAKDAVKRVQALIAQGQITKAQGQQVLRDIKAFANKKETEIERLAIREARREIKTLRKVSKKHLVTLRMHLERLEKNL